MTPTDPKTPQAAETETVAAPPPDPLLVEILPGGQKVKRRKPKMRACNEKDEKGKLCAGHLKRWYFYGPEIEQRFGAEIYRCENCKTLWLPNEGETPRSGTLAY